jgi:uncharacterized integral membrane protein (TIGR00698 family)
VGTSIETVSSTLVSRPVTEVRLRAVVADGRRTVPGLAAAAGATVVAFIAAAFITGANAGSVAVALGAIVVNIGGVRPSLQPGLALVTRSGLRIAVVLLGLQLSIGDVGRLGGAGLLVVAGTVSVTFAGTQLLGRALGVRRPLGLLVATGFSICGASAVAGMQPVADGEKDDTVVAVALVTLCGSLAIVVLPFLRVPLGLDYASFGSWVGASVHDVGQTVATANRVGHGALEPAVVVKLTRVVLLAPLVAGVAIARRRGLRTASAAGRLPPVVPLFVIGFVVAVGVRSSGWVPAPVLSVADGSQQILLTAALFGLGTGISWPVLRRAGGRPLVLGGLAWLLVAGVSYAAVRLTGA